MDDKTKAILIKLRGDRYSRAIINFNDDVDKASKETEIVANIQTAITGILQEEILELQLKQPKKKTGSGSTSFITFQN